MGTQDESLSRRYPSDDSRKQNAMFDRPEGSDRHRLGADDKPPAVRKKSRFRMRCDYVQSQQQIT